MNYYIVKGERNCYEVEYDVFLFLCMKVGIEYQEKQMFLSFLCEEVGWFKEIDIVFGFIGVQVGLGLVLLDFVSYMIYLDMY